jgi:DNA-binding SARP family transcriptional activator/Flp pilus assembly protein TadD
MADDPEVTLRGGMAAQAERARYYLLGPLEVRNAEQLVEIRSGRERALLAALLLRANRLVTVDELVEAVWGQRPPDNPRATVQTLVMRLRKKLHGGIQTHPGGYLATPSYVDLDEFRRHVALANQAAKDGDRERESAELGAGLALWRGPVLANVPSEALHRDVVAALVEERLAALHQRIEADLELGRADSVIAELRRLVAEHPLRERLWALLMRALLAAGRRAQALEAFEVIRQRLIVELGTQPDEELQRLHLSMLDAEPHTITRSAPRIVPRQLPPDVRGFTGRRIDLDRLDAQLSEHATGGSRAVLITAIAGTAGVGKTALAVHWGRRVAHRFPDGQLWVNLRGYDPDQPMTPGHALVMFLRALGVAGPEIPIELDARTALFRTLLEDRRMLIVLDNANSAEQVRPLLAGAPACLTVVTSRDDLSGLVARDGAARVRLDLLDRRDSVELLQQLLGSGDRQALERVAVLCARLPLALRIAADRLSTAGGQLETAVAKLADEPPLDALAAGNDPHTAARAVFSWSYQALSPDVAASFRSLGLFPGEDWDAYAGAALIGSSLTEARSVLSVLASGHLIEDRDGRYHLHDLLRAYALELVRDSEAREERQATLGRLFDFYLAAASAAMDIAVPSEQHRRQQFSAPGLTIPTFDRIEGALRWLDAERANLLAIARAAIDHDSPSHTIRLASTLFRYLLSGAHHADALTIHQLARRAAEQAQDRTAEGNALHGLGVTYHDMGRFDEALNHYGRALAIRSEIGDRMAEASTVNNIGVLLEHRGSYEESIRYSLRSLNILHELGDRWGEGVVLNSIGTVRLKQGRHREALDYLEQALPIRKEIGDLHGVAGSLDTLGLTFLGLGDISAALRHCTESLAIIRKVGDRANEAEVLGNIARIHTRAGRHREAADRWTEALAITRELGQPRMEAALMNGLGMSSREAGQLDAALEHHRVALGLARELGDGAEQGRALNGIGQAWRSLGKPDRARQSWSEALAILTDLGVPEVAGIRAQLAELDEPVTT